MHKFSKTMKIIRSILLLSVGFGTLPAQGATDHRRLPQKAQANYPLVAQYGLIRQSEQYDLKNANKGYLPQLSLSAKSLLPDRRDENPVLVAGHRHPDPQQRPVSGRSRGEPGNLGRQNIRAKKQNVKASAEVDLQQQQVDMYAIREQVNSLFFGILLTEEQLELNRLYDGELERNYRKISSFIENGVANKPTSTRCRSNSSPTVRARLARSDQPRVPADAGSSSAKTPTAPKLICPEVGSEPAPTDVNRPELRLLDAATRCWTPN